MKNTPEIIARAQHTLSRSMVDKYALKVLYRLHDAGYQAYLVGGCVRDLLLKVPPKDFDVATDATPEQVKTVFRNCRLIGRRFRLAHIYFGRHIIEVATFRGNIEEANDKDHLKKDGIVVRDNVFGSIEQDVWRRDFSINALYYNIADFSIVDYVGGLKDMQKKELHIIGNAEVRYREDPLRMLRAIRFASKLNFTIAKETAKPLTKHGEWLEHIAPSRLLDEVIKLFHSGHASSAYTLLKKYHLFEVLLPATHEELKTNPQTVDTFLRCLFNDTDRRIKEEKTVSSAYLFAVLLWPVVSTLRDSLTGDTHTAAQALIEAGYQVLFDQSSLTTIPKRLSHHIHQVWRLQYRFDKPSKKILLRTLKHTRFRAAIDLFKLRAKASPSLQPQLDWWQKHEHSLKKEQAQIESDL